ncbi:MAG: radical SAM protein [Methylocystis sp.]|nr:radical SAM protein [Methylocystis sp.]
MAALAPADFQIAICDENISAVDFDHPADWIAITGKVNQRRRLTAIADDFRRRGKRVIIGGPYASLSPARLRPHCDILVCGEIEDIAAELFADLRAGRPRQTYIGDRPDLARSPMPRWELYPNQRALAGAVQTSRGCPFECEFCDVIQYLGRKQRHKPIAKVLAELDALFAQGYRTVFLADDNFTAYRRRCKELLDAMAWWRRRHPVDFVTQLSIDAARDEELLDMCAAAGLTQVFVGVETPNEESLRETGKRQNLRVDLAEEVQRFIDHGIAVSGGLIVGFDADGPDVFDQQYEFAMSTAVPMFSLGALVASEATPLYERIVREGRLSPGADEVQGVPWASNIEPRNMSGEELRGGVQRLCNALYAPAAFGERMLRFIESFGQARRDGAAAPPVAGAVREVDAQAIQLALDVRRMGEQEARMWGRVWRAVSRRPAATPFVMRMLFQYAQARHMFRQGDYWEPQLGAALTAARPTALAN